MNVSLKGIRRNMWYRPIEFLMHKGRCMTDIEARTVVNYAIAHNTEEVPEEVLDAIVDPCNHEYRQYEDPETEFTTLETVRATLMDFRGKTVTEELITEILGQL